MHFISFEFTCIILVERKYDGMIEFVDCFDALLAAITIRNNNNVKLL